MTIDTNDLFHYFISVWYDRECFESNNVETFHQNNFIYILLKKKNSLIQIRNEHFFNLVCIYTCEGAKSRTDTLNKTKYEQTKNRKPMCEMGQSHSHFSQSLSWEGIIKCGIYRVEIL